MSIRSCVQVPHAPALKSSGFNPRSEAVRFHSNSMCKFSLNHGAVLWCLHQFVSLPAVQAASSFSMSSPTFLISGFFLNNNHPNGHEVVPHCDFDLYFSNE